ncbi:MAG: efflux RND transporter periplasmic adaptor subunit [Alphaproteobacteria bacterium]|nr:efflux RND transporter periplasmic adaptor subunit [Alphaproteobacteria bacterium]
MELSMGRASKFWVASGVAALLLGGGGYHYLTERDAPAGPVAQAATPPAEKTVAVEAERASVGVVLEDLNAVGTLRANEAVAVSPEIAGRIDRIRFDEGDEVAAGDVLVELDAAILRAELAKARSDLTLAEANRTRAMTLARQGTGTLRARDEALAAHQAAQANIALAQARLDKASIRAPLSGIVGLRAVSAGAYVTPGDRIVELADIDPIKVDFRVPELALSSLRPGQAIRVAVDAVPGKTFDGAVYVIDPIVDENGRAIRLRARVANPDRALFPGLFARVQIVIERRANSVLVSESAVFARGQERFVYRVVDGRAVLTKIELGQRRPGQVEVTAGLAPDAVVVTAGHQQVRDGGRVEIIEPRTGS